MTLAQTSRLKPLLDACVKGILRALVLLVSVSLFSCASPPAAKDNRAQPGAAAPAVSATQAPEPPSVPVPEETAAPLVIGVEDAVLTALENNPELAVERLNPRIQSTFEDEEAASFDPSLSAEASHDRQKSERLTGAGPATESAVAQENAGDLTLSKTFPTGTEVALEALTSQTNSSQNPSPFNSTRAGLSVTQSLLRGFGSDSNLVGLRQARLDTAASEYELRGFTEALVADVETKYWDYFLALREIEIFTESLKVAEQALSEIEERVNIGDLAEIELAAGQAEVALRREDLIDASGNLAVARLRLLQLLSPPGARMWDRDVQLSDKPSEPPVSLDEVSDHVALALEMRPDLNQSRLAIERDQLEVVKTRNGLLPKLDLFITLGKTGYADSFRSSAGDVGGDDYDVNARLSLEYALGNRAARARFTRAALNRSRSDGALRNLAALVELDVRTAHIELQRAAEQVVATAATRRLQEETLRGENEKFRVGKSTAFLVAQAQRDLLVSQIGEVRAVVNYSKALVTLYRLDGSLLLRRGIAAPGAKSPDPAAPK